MSNSWEYPLSPDGGSSLSTEPSSILELERILSTTHQPSLRVRPNEHDDDLAKELRSNMCTTGILKMLKPSSKSSSKAMIRAPVRKTANYSRATGKLPKDKQTLLVRKDSEELVGGRSKKECAYDYTEGMKARSPSAESTGSEQQPINNSCLGKRNTRGFKRFFSSSTTSSGKEGEVCNEDSPYFVLRSDPSIGTHNELNHDGKEDTLGVNGDKSFRDKTCGKDKKQSDGSSSKKTVSLSPRRGKPVAWSTPLASVVEGAAEDTLSPESEPVVESPASTRGIPEPEMVLAMKHLVRKQQKSIEEMEKENRRFREELEEYRKMLSEAKCDRSRQEDKIGRLTAEKETSESQALWLQEEMRALKAEIAQIKASQIQTSRLGAAPSSMSEQDPDIARFEVVKKVIYGKFALANSASSDAGSISDTSYCDKGDDVTASSSGMSLNAELEFQDAGSTGSGYRVMRGTLDRPASETSLASAERSKEEINQFKSRLEAIQKKREERKIRESGFGNKSSRVRFD